MPPRPCHRQEPGLPVMLDAGMHVKLTLILVPKDDESALAVRGEERAAIEGWATRQTFPVKRLSLTSADAHPVAFLDQLSKALDDLVHVEIAPDQASEARVSVLVNAILDVPMDFALLLFGYHVVGEQEVHRLLGRILDYQPPQMHLYIVTPAVPPLPNLPRLRVRRQVLLVRWPEQ